MEINGMTIGDVDDLGDEMQRLIIAQYHYNRAVKRMIPSAAWQDACERVNRAVNNGISEALVNAQIELELSGEDLQ